MSLSTTILPAPGIGGYSYNNGLFFTYNQKTQRPIEHKVCRIEIGWWWELASPGSGWHNSRVFKDEISPYLGITTNREWQTEEFASRWHEMEKSLGLSKYTVVHPTDKTGAIILKFSPFWMANDTRRSLATLLMRMWLISPTAKLDTAIDNYDLSEQVKPAIKWFMAGHTKPTYDVLSVKRPGDGYLGFVNEMTNIDDLSTKLVKEAA